MIRRCLVIYLIGGTILIIIAIAIFTLLTVMSFVSY